jgi:membrane fusion protein (multidrug efflux system)
MIKRFIIAAIVVALFLGGLSYFQFVFKPAMVRDFVAKMVPPAATVTAEPAALERWTDKLHSIGTLIAIEGVDVSPQVGGLVTDYSFESGEDVEAGARLVQLDVSVEEADLKNNRAQLKEARLDFDRRSDLVDKGHVAQAALDTSIAKRDSAAAAVERVEAIIEQKTITAPFAGRLGLRRVEKGQYVSPGQALVWLESLDPIWIDFPIPEGEIAKVNVGSGLEVTVDAYPDQVFKGEVEAFDARVNKDSRTLTVRGRLPNPDRRLLPGMFANAAVLSGEPKELVTVPRTAVTYGLYGDSVYVVKRETQEAAETPKPDLTSAVSEPGTATAAEAPEDAPAEPKLTVERRFVRVGPRLGDRVAIVDGIEAGEEVVTSGQIKLKPGATVTIDNTRALQPLSVRPKQ